jgi:hypothetical protein
MAVGLKSHIIEISSEERRAPALIVSTTRHLPRRGRP